MKKCISILLAVAVMLCMGTVFADGPFTLTESGTLTFTGTADMTAFDAVNDKMSKNDTLSKSVVAILFKPDGIDKRADMNRGSLADYIAGFTTTTVQDDGTYAFEINMKGVTGTYKLLVSNPVLGEEVYDVEWQSRFYIDFNTAVMLEDVTELESLVLENAEILCFDRTGYELLSEEAQTEILNSMLTADEMAGDEELKDYLVKVPISAKIFETSSEVSKIVDYITTASTLENNPFSNDIVKYLLEEMSEDSVENIVSKYMGEYVVADEAFFDSLALNILKTTVPTFTMSLQMKDFLTSDIWGFDAYDIEIYNELNDTTDVDDGMLNGIGDVETLDEYAELYHDLVADAKEDEDDDDEGSSGGGRRPSGGGGGGGVVVKNSSDVTTPVVTPPVEAKPEEKSFKDLDGYEWAEPSISVLLDKGIISGYSADEFRPSNNITREEFVKLLTAGLKLTGAEAVADFTDVDETDWFYRPVAAALRAGIIKGNSDKSFGTGTNITRQDMAVMLARAAEFKGHIWQKLENVEFVDYDDVATYAVDAVEKLSKNDVINGMADGSFMPKQNLTRAEAAKVIHGFLNLVGMLN